MCNPRSTTLPATLVTLSSGDRLLSWLVESGIGERLRTLLRELFIAALQRRQRTYGSEHLHQDMQR